MSILQYKVKIKFTTWSIFNYFELSGTFSIAKNNCLQHYVNVFNKNIYYMITNHLKYNKIV